MARFELIGAGGSIELPSRKLAGLLGYLACTAPVPQPREKLATLLWGSHFETQARQNLRQALFRLRRALGEDAFIGNGEEISLAPGVVDCDVARLEALIREDSRASLAEAVDLYKEGLLADVTITEEAWADWVAGERQRLEGLALDALLRLGEMELGLAHADKALATAHRALSLNSLREDAHRLILQALAAAGRKAEALKHYQDLVALLKRELNTEPDAATKLLVAELGSAQPRSPSPAAKEILEPALPPSDPPLIAVLPNTNADQDVNIKPLAGQNEAAAPAVAVRSGVPERRQLTIIICSLVCSMPPSAGVDPEDMRDQIAAFHKMAADVVARFDGFLAQYLGDGVHVYFGYPAAHEHDVEQAVRAGLAILDAVGTLKATSDEPLQASIGIATGLVVVGEHLGAGGTWQHVAIGEAPTLAAQLQAVAPPGEVVIAAGTRRLAGGIFQCRPLSANELKGLPQLVEAWQVRGETANVSRFEARRAGALSPLVGRQEEIDILLRRWDQAKLGEGRVVLLSGEPGIGKSRIAETLLARLEDETYTRLLYFCSPHHMHSALYPFIAQLERTASFDPNSSANEKLDKLEALLKPTSRNVTRDVALIAELLALPADGRYTALAVSPEQKREMTLAALLDQLDGVAANSPVLIVFEDIHWIDPTSLDLLDRTIARVANLPVLMVITFRPELRPHWVGEPHVMMLSLSRLGRRESADLLGGITKGKVLPNAVVEQVLAHTDGVPLFIEELTSTLLESGLLRETPDRYVLDGPLPSLSIPTTLQGSLMARLDRLASPKDVAQIGAAIGREFSHELIAAVAALAPKDLNAALERLMASGLISRRGTPPDATYSFKHALIQDAAYLTMLRSRRRQLHASIAKVLVERYSTMAETMPEVVAHHFTEAGLSSEAIGYWRKAGQRAGARSAMREAVKFFEQALSIVETQPQTRSLLEEGFDIRLELRPALTMLGEIQQGLQRLHEAGLIAEQLDDDTRRGRVCALSMGLHTLLGELDQSLAFGDRALQFAERTGDLKLRLLTTTYLQQTHYSRGEYMRVIELATSSIEALPADWIYENFGNAAPASVYDRCWLVLALAEVGRFTDAADPVAEAFRLSAPMNHAFTSGMSYWAASTLQILRCDWAKARPVIEGWIPVVEAGNVVLLLPLAITSFAWVLAQVGEAGEASKWLRKGEQLLGRQAVRERVTAHGLAYHALGRTCLLLGRLDDAQSLADRAIDFSPGHHGIEAHALHLLGDVASHPDRFDAERGEVQYRRALALAEPRGMRPLVAHCHLGLGKLYSRAGKRKQAIGNLAAASTLYRELDMEFSLEQTQKQSLG